MNPRIEASFSHHLIGESFWIFIIYAHEFFARTPRLCNQARGRGIMSSCRCTNSRRVEGRRLGLTYLHFETFVAD